MDIGSHSIRAREARQQPFHEESKEFNVQSYVSERVATLEDERSIELKNDFICFRARSDKKF